MSDKQWDDDAFLGSSGLVREFVLTVQESKAATPEGWNGPVWILKGEGKLPDGEIKDGLDLRMSFGSFEPGDDEGSFIIHDTQDPKKKVNSNTGMMRFIASIKDAENGDALKAELQRRSRVIDGIDLQNRDLSIWKGLVLSINHKSRAWENKDKGTSGVAEDPYLVAYLGTVDSPVEATGSSAAGTNGSGGGFSEEDAVALAKGSDTFVKYLVTLTEEKGVDQSSPLATQDFYAKARG